MIDTILQRAIEVLGDEKAAEKWLSAPKVALGGRIPRDCAGTEQGAREVLNLLGRLEHGVF